MERGLLYYIRIRVFWRDQHMPDPVQTDMMQFSPAYCVDNIVHFFNFLENVQDARIIHIR